MKYAFGFFPHCGMQDLCWQGNEYKLFWGYVTQFKFCIMQVIYKIYLSSYALYRLNFPFFMFR